MFATKDKITQIQFNQDGTCFIAAQIDGFSVYNTDPFKEIYRQKYDNIGIKVSAMLWKSSLIAFTGASSIELERYIASMNKNLKGKAQKGKQNKGKDQILNKGIYSHLYSPIIDYQYGKQNHSYDKNQEKLFQPNIVYLYDVQTDQIFGKIKYKSEVFNIQMRKDVIIVKLQNQLYLHTLSQLFLIDVLDTTDYAPPFSVTQLPLDITFAYLKETCQVDAFNDENIKQYFTINNQFNEQDFILVYVSPENQGRININYYLFGSNDSDNIVIHKYFDLFNEAIAQISIDLEGRIIVVASKCGQIVVINTQTHTLIAKLDDLADQAQITGIQIKSDLRQILITYKGGCAIYNINQINGQLISSIQENDRFITLSSNVKFQNSGQICQTFGLNQDIFITISDSNIYIKEKIRGNRQQQPIARVQLI